VYVYNELLYVFFPFQNLETISELRETLSKILKVDTRLLWVVQKERGIIYDDERKLMEMKKHQSIIEIVIGNPHRTVEEPEPDVISGELIRSNRCDMTCTHLTSNVFCIICLHREENT
jgi:hypothetical protein